MHERAPLCCRIQEDKRTNSLGSVNGEDIQIMIWYRWRAHGKNIAEGGGGGAWPEFRSGDIILIII